MFGKMSRFCDHLAEETESIFLEVCWLSMLKFKSPDVSDMPVSTAKAFESSIREK